MRLTAAVAAARRYTHGPEKYAVNDRYKYYARYKYVHESSAAVTLKTAPIL